MECAMPSRFLGPNFPSLLQSRSPYSGSHSIGTRNESLDLPCDIQTFRLRQRVCEPSPWPLNKILEEEELPVVQSLDSREVAELTFGLRGAVLLTCVGFMLSPEIPLTSHASRQCIIRTTAPIVLWVSLPIYTSTHPFAVL